MSKSGFLTLLLLVPGVPRGLQEEERGGGGPHDGEAQEEAASPLKKAALTRGLYSNKQVP